MNTSVVNCRISSYHFHIYYSLEEKEKAVKLRDALLHAVEHNEWLDGNIRVGKMHDEPVGPHKTPMFQVAVTQTAFHMSINYLMLHRNGLTVLVHPETGDALKDHTDHAMWLGNKLDLDISKV